MNSIKQLMIITFLTSSLCIVGMQEQSRLASEYQEQSLLASAYNNNHTLLRLPHEVLEPIILASVVTQKSLNDSITTALSLNFVCKNFNAIIAPDRIGKACKHYEQEEKNKMMEKLLWSMNDLIYQNKRHDEQEEKDKEMKKLLQSMIDFSYWNKRHAAMMLVYAGADNQANKYCSLLRRAIHQNDKDMITILFANNANPKQLNWDGNPDFFAIENIDMLKMFIDKGIDINAGNNDYPNVLWYCLVRHPFSELIEFYLQNKVDATKIKTSSGDCLLRQFVKCAWSDKKSIEDYIKIGELLFNAAPEMINRINRDKETPLDVTQRRLKKITFISDSEVKTLEALIPFFEKRGGKTAQQLKAAQQQK